jgi:hypothetical protein
VVREPLAPLFSVSPAGDVRDDGLVTGGTLAVQTNFYILEVQPAAGIHRIDSAYTSQIHAYETGLLHLMI